MPILTKSPAKTSTAKRVAVRRASFCGGEGAVKCFKKRYVREFPPLANVAGTKPLDGGDHCYSHSPDRAEERKKNAALGGASRTRQSSEVARIEAIDRELKKVTQDVLAGRLSEDAGRVAIQGLNARLRATKVKQETVEFEDYGRRISELERRANQPPPAFGGRRRPV